MSSKVDEKSYCKEDAIFKHGKNANVMKCSEYVDPETIRKQIIECDFNDEQGLDAETKGLCRLNVKTGGEYTLYT